MVGSELKAAYRRVEDLQQRWVTDTDTTLFHPVFFFIKVCGLATIIAGSVALIPVLVGMVIGLLGPSTLLIWPPLAIVTLGAFIAPFGVLLQCCLYGLAAYHYGREQLIKYLKKFNRSV